MSELETGIMAPGFVTEAADGKSISLAALQGEWVVLYFYPKDDTPGCTREACAFRDANQDMQDLNAVVLGCSPDGHASHEKFTTKYNLPFILISDSDHSIAQKYDVWKEKNMYGKKFMGIDRSTFLINPKGQIHKIWRRVKVDGHVDAVIEEIKNA